MAPGAWEAVMKDKGHDSQKTFSLNFTLPFDRAASSSTTAHADTAAASSLFNHAPHGLTGAPTRPLPTWAECVFTSQALVERLATRVFIESPTCVDPYTAAGARGEGC